MLKAIKIRLYPSENQINYINKLFGSSRFVYNNCLNYKITEYQLWNNTSNIENIMNDLKSNFELYMDAKKYNL